jgi:hypothetical protein
MNTEIKSSNTSTDIVQKPSKEEIIELLKEENPLIQENEKYSQLILVLETKKLQSNLGIIKGEYYQDYKLEYRGSLLVPLNFIDQKSIWANLKESESAFYGFTLDSREMKIPEKIMAFFNRSFADATIQDFIPFGGGKRPE